MSNLGKFIEELSTNPKLQQSYAASPTDTMKKYGLSEAEISAVVSGKKEQVEKLIGKAVKPVTFFFIPK